MDLSGNVFVTDTQNHTLRKITAGGTVTTLAGTAGSIGASDGTGNTAQFSTPFGLAVDRNGNLFDADQRNHTIRKITADGIVTTLAGTAGMSGDADGMGSAARFNSPQGVAVDGSGNVFVADIVNNTIRKITPGGVVTTVAGKAGFPGSADGTGSAAQFNGPRCLVVDSSGSLFATDLLNHLIRKITVAGAVTTLAGSAGVSGSADGVGGAARFNFPEGLAVDGSGNIFVAERGNHTIRKITASGVVTTIAGSAGVSGSADGTGNAALFNVPLGVAVDGSGNLFVADRLNHTIRKGVAVFGAPSLVAAPQPRQVKTGASVTFTVAAIGSELRYQWRKDGISIVGATNSTYQLGSTVAGDMGSYSVVVTSGGGTVESPAALLTVSSSSRLSNLSARGLVPAGGDLTVGFVIRGSGSKSLLVRGVGPTLGSFGVAGALADPKLDVIPAGASIATSSNDDWGGGAALAGAFADAGAFALPAASKDAAVLGTLTVAGYSARITSATNGGTGIAIAELYDRDAASTGSQLVNVSTLGFVGTGAQVLVPGFVISGTEPKRLLIRAVGPGLAPFGVTDALADPQIAVIPLGGTSIVASNDNWGGDTALVSAFAAAGAFALPASSKDGALVVRLPTGPYTVTVSGVGNTTGRALVEIYDLDP